jgi:cytochrome b subunit of formate dehydrogenase
MAGRSMSVPAIAVLVLAAALALLPGAAKAGGLDNAACLECHDSSKAKIDVPAKDGKRPLGAVNHAKFQASLHAKLPCVDCHQDITDAQAQHKKIEGAKKADCAQCHLDLWDKAKEEKAGPRKDRLGVVEQNIEAYIRSFHARPSKGDKSRVNATCHECHDTHEFNVPRRNTETYARWRLSIPELCAAACHEEQLDDYKASVHGKAALGERRLDAAVCTDCHNTHNILSFSGDPFKLAITDNCGDCHKKELKSYLTTYHGQVRNLGYTYTAKCYNCHGSHKILTTDNPKSMVFPDNRLKTCQECHSDKKPGMHEATAGFASFGAHANAQDFAKYPQVWLASKFMVGLLLFVFAFFWSHSGLWYWREWQDRRAGKTVTHVNTAAFSTGPRLHVKRFAAGWRIAHLLFALSTMTLVLSGTSAMFAETEWASFVAKMAGGPKILGYIHRVAAFIFVALFVGHLVYIVHHLFRLKNFRWFGPDSLLPNWKDLEDCIGMFNWFLGRGPKPKFDRWAYFEKFDYWAVFWGVNVIGWSGLMLAFPHVTAAYLPGWVFNVATLVHGEEAFLAAVFLFTVHFFNNHFRPDKLPPPDVVMFTGTQTLEEFRRDHPAQYERLIANGELEQYLVEAPSPEFHASSVLLGLTLITIGLILLVLVGIGFFASLG